MSTIRVSKESGNEMSASAAPSGSLPKGLAMLELLSSNEGSMGITALAQRMHIPKSGVHRLLQVLRDNGWVRQTLSGEYECTLKLWELGQRLASKIDLRRAAKAAMRELAARTRETIMLSVLDGSEVLYLEVLDSPQPVRVHTNPGDRAPAFCMATGKALLAHAPAAVIDSVAGNLHKFTARTITTRAKLERELEGVRQHGFAVSHGEWNEGVMGIASPLFDSSFQAVAAISIGAPSERMSDVVVNELAPLVVKAAQQVSRELGCPSRER